MKVTPLISSTALLAGLFVLVTHTAAAQQPVSAAQQAPDPARVTAPASSSGVSSSSALAGPRLPPEFQRAEPTLARNTTSEASSLAVAGSHTIVISTLVLVLAVIIVVLLVAK